jgi:hypothetical protein
MRTIQGKGPFLLYAICGGGSLAWESARQLLACGQEIAGMLFYEVPFPRKLVRLAVGSSQVPSSEWGGAGDSWGRYQPPPLPVDLTQLMTEEWHANGRSAGWTQVAQGSNQTHLLPGEIYDGHDVYRRREHLIADRIRNWLETTEARLRQV